MKRLKVSGWCATRNGHYVQTITINLENGLIETVESGYDSGADLAFPPESSVWIFPGITDVHVHGRQDRTGKQNYKEDFVTLGEAAINGGVVAVGAMPNTPEPPVEVGIYRDICEMASGSRITVVPYGAIAPGSRPFAGIRAPYKTFLAESVNDLKFSSEDEASKTLPYYNGEEVSAHCDDNAILAECAQEATHERRRPGRSETRAIEFILSEQRRCGFHLKIVHVSTEKSLQLIRDARCAGRRILAEATPQHTFMCIEELTPENSRRWRMNPPIRPRSDMRAISNALKDGCINMLATDHAPHTLQEKGLLPDQLSDETVNVVSGTPQLDTYGPYLTWLAKERAFNTSDIWRFACWNPGRWISQFLPQRPENGLGFGDIAPHFIGSLSVIDFDNPLTLQADMLKTKCGWSPFEGFTFPGRVLHTIIRGEVLK